MVTRKSVLVVALAVVLLWSGISYATYVKGETTTHRSAVSSNDTGFEVVAAGSGINAGNFGTIVLDIMLTGVSPQWTITPGYYSTEASAYVSGSSMTITQSGRYTIETYGNRDIYILCHSKSGTNPTITIYATPVDTKEFR